MENETDAQDGMSRISITVVIGEKGELDTLDWQSQFSDDLHEDEALYWSRVMTGVVMSIREDPEKYANTYIKGQLIARMERIHAESLARRRMRMMEEQGEKTDNILIFKGQS